MEELKNPVYEEILNYNALKKVSTKIPKSTVQVLEKEANKLAAERQEDFRQFPVVNALENIELKFYNHNA